MSGLPAALSAGAGEVVLAIPSGLLEAATSNFQNKPQNNGSGGCKWVVESMEFIFEYVDKVVFNRVLRLMY